jgi:hypothetical protein
MTGLVLAGSICVVFGTVVRRAGWSRRTVPRALSRRAACVLPGLLLIASIVPAARASSPTGPVGGASRAAATALKNGLSYRSQVAPGRQAWYALEARQDERVSIRLWGRTRSCPVRMTLIDPHGLALGEIVSTAREIEPFIVYYPKGENSSDYYLRVQQASAARCASAAYVFTLREPEQAQESCETTTGPHGELIEACVAPSKIVRVPADEARVCVTASRSYRKLESEFARERSRSVRKHLEAEIVLARRAVIRGCRY